MITVLGTPIGSEQYISEQLEERLAKERALWDAIPAWLVTASLSAIPRANHTMRTMPPSCSAAYCSPHDVGIWNTAKVLLDVHSRWRDKTVGNPPN